MEFTANGLLAIGASPVMAHASEEVKDIVKIAKSLVLNIGTLSPSWIISMLLSLREANLKKIPVVFDPVGVGASSYRTKSAHSILENGKITVIRGNASEIVSLCGAKCAHKGVDSLLKTIDHQEQAQILALKNHCVVWMSGETDVITDGQSNILIHNGHSLMSKITGTGCLATALTGAFLAVNPNSLQGSAHAAILMGIAGEIAAEKSKGPGSFRQNFFDKLYSITLKEIEQRIDTEIL